MRSILRKYIYRLTSKDNSMNMNSPGRNSSGALPPVMAMKIARFTQTRRVALSLQFICLGALILPCRAHAWEMKKAPLMTPWAAKVDTKTPMPEYPRPQMVRADWLNLNGVWQFQPGNTNDAAPVGKSLAQEILVPYPMESALSGIMAYHPHSWYRRLFTVPPGWAGRRILLHLDAVSWESEVYLNGASVGMHKGGYDPICYDITSQLNGQGPQELIVRVYAPVDAVGEPRGKQTLHPRGIMYTPSSGIWQPAWLEPVAAGGIRDLKLTSEVDQGRLSLTVSTFSAEGIRVTATVTSNGVPVAAITGAPNTELQLPVPQPRLWSPDDPFLYDLKIVTLQGEATNDTVTSYFGMRKISVGLVDGIKKMLLNNQFVFQIGPLDQGFWPDGIYTAPTDEALRFDLEQEKLLGFNMVRKHIKVERARWYYWADKLGILVWQDMPSVNSYMGKDAVRPAVDKPQFRVELNRMIETHWNSPSIILWVIFNESQGQHDTQDLVREVAAKDPSRLVNQASGGTHFGVGDILDIHSYAAANCPVSTTQARACGEFGGIGCQVPGHLWDPARAAGNYSKANDTAELARKYDLFISDVVGFKTSQGLSAAVYTEITDVENECNGLLTYDRAMKADVNRISAANRKAITAQLKLTPVVPASLTEGVSWKYTTNAPAPNWFAAQFEDARWATGPGGFGAKGRTPWEESDLWLRRQFTLASLTPAELARLVLVVAREDDCEIYLNGVLAAKPTGRSAIYSINTLSDAAKAALVQPGVNVLAVHARKGKRPPFIDVGLSLAEFY